VISGYFLDIMMMKRQADGPEGEWGLAACDEGMAKADSDLMNRIWAPWRAAYLQAAAATAPEDGCFLCHGLKSRNDRENLVVWRCPHSVVVLNRYPYNNGHLLVAPHAHQAALADLTGKQLTEPLETIRTVMAALDRILHPEGYNVGLNQGRAAGAGLPGHLHWHVVPRWNGDTNFMPVVGHAKVIVESLDAFYLRLAGELATIAETGLA